MGGILLSQNRLCKRYSNVVFTAAILLSVGVMVSLCFNNSVWFDEAYSTFMARQSYWGIIEQNLTDVHPPLYYFVLKLVTSVFGYNLLVMKLVSVAGVTATDGAGRHSGPASVRGPGGPFVYPAFAMRTVYAVRMCGDGAYVFLGNVFCHGQRAACL